MEIRLRYLPIADAQEGMILGAPLVVTENGVSNFSLPAGHALTETNLRQMSIRQAEFVCVQIPDERSEAERDAEWKASEARLRHIFRASNLEEPVVAKLYSAVLSYRRM